MVYLYLHLVDFYGLNVGKYTIRGWYGMYSSVSCQHNPCNLWKLVSHESIQTNWRKLNPNLTFHNQKFMALPDSTQSSNPKPRLVDQVYVGSSAGSASWLLDRWKSSIPCHHCCEINSISHRIHGTGIFHYIYHKNQPNVGEYTIHGSLGYIPSEGTTPPEIERIHTKNMAIHIKGITFCKAHQILGIPASFRGE